MNGSLRATLLNATEYEAPDRRVRAVKEAVSNFLHASDPSTQIRHTEYFNHTFAPDLVVSWPKEARSRYVFLRSTSDPLLLAHDLEIVAQSHPIMLSLEGVYEDIEPDPAKDRLARAAKGASALVTDSDAIEQISAQQAPMASIFADAMLRGGRGFLDEGTAQGAARASAEGFSGAATLDAEPISRALESAEDLLDSEQAGRITRLLRAVWEGHGGDAAFFPEGATPSGPMTSTDISLLLRTVDSDNPQFWRRIGRNLTFDLVSDLVVEESDGLNLLIAANLDRLWARAARVFGESQTQAEGPTLQWSIHGRCLKLRGAAWEAYFASKMDDLPRHRPRSGAAASRLETDVRDLELRLADVKVQHASFTISIEAVGDTNVLDSPDFAELASRDDAVVRSAAVAIQTGRNLIIEFVTGTASGHTSANFTLAELIMAVVSLLLGLSRAEAQQVRSTMQAVADTEGYRQDPLWD